MSVDRKQFREGERVEVQLAIGREWTPATYVRREADGRRHHAVTIDGDGGVASRRRTVSSRSVRRASWTCHARPPALDGKPCGFENVDGGSLSVFQGDTLVSCASCGRTKHASDDRERRRVGTLVVRR